MANVVSTSVEFQQDGSGRVLGLVSRQQNGDIFAQRK